MHRALSSVCKRVKPANSEILSPASPCPSKTAKHACILSPRSGWQIRALSWLIFSIPTSLSHTSSRTGFMPGLEWKPTTALGNSGVSGVSAGVDVEGSVAEIRLDERAETRLDGDAIEQRRVNGLISSGGASAGAGGTLDAPHPIPAGSSAASSRASWPRVCSH